METTLRTDKEKIFLRKDLKGVALPLWKIHLMSLMFWKYKSVYWGRKLIGLVKK